MSTLRYAYNVHSCFRVLLQSGNNPKCSSTSKIDQFWNTQVGYYSVIKRSKLLIQANYINQHQENYADWEARPPPLRYKLYDSIHFYFRKYKLINRNSKQISRYITNGHQKTLQDNENVCCLHYTDSFTYIKIHQNCIV